MTTPVAPEPDNNDVLEQFRLSRYWKAVVAIFGASIAFATLIITDDQAGIQADEWLQGAILYGTALGVYAVPNRPAPEVTA